MREHLLSVHQVAELTGWSPFTIYKKSAAGEIPGRVKLGKSSLRFKASEIDAWLSGDQDSHAASGGTAR